MSKKGANFGENDLLVKKPRLVYIFTETLHIMGLLVIKQTKCRKKQAF